MKELRGRANQNHTNTLLKGTRPLDVLPTEQMKYGHKPKLFCCAQTL